LSSQTESAAAWRKFVAKARGPGNHINLFPPTPVRTIRKLAHVAGLPLGARIPDRRGKGVSICSEHRNGAPLLKKPNPPLPAVAEPSRGGIAGDCWKKKASISRRCAIKLDIILGHSNRTDLRGRTSHLPPARGRARRRFARTWGPRLSTKQKAARTPSTPLEDALGAKQPHCRYRGYFARSRETRLPRPEALAFPARARKIMLRIQKIAGRNKSADEERHRADSSSTCSLAQTARPAPTRILDPREKKAGIHRVSVCRAILGRTRFREKARKKEGLHNSPNRPKR